MPVHLSMCMCECKHSRKPEGSAVFLGTVSTGSQKLSEADAGNQHQVFARAVRAFNQ